MRLMRSESIELLGRRYDYFPASFRWRGRRFRVSAVEQCWTVRRSPLRRVFRVRCAAGCFELEQSVADDAWRLRRRPAPWRLSRRRRASVPQYPLPRSQRRPPDRPSLAIRLRSHPWLRAADSLIRRDGQWTPTLLQS